MNKKADRYTVAYESKAYPYFTINQRMPFVLEGPRGGTSAFFERLDFVKSNLDMLKGLGVVVDTDCGFHVRSEVEFEQIHAQICAYFSERDNVAGAEDWHEAL